ncbi:hypothetical protein ACX84U_32275, partial [Burkholderia pseudomallei]
QLWTMRETDFLALPDELSGGSSLMPQKKNLAAGCFAACGGRPAGRRRFASSHAWIAGGARRSDCFARVFRACGR